MRVGIAGPRWPEARGPRKNLDYEKLRLRDLTVWVILLQGSRSWKYSKPPYAFGIQEI
jgi:hypothetical protein